MAENLVSLVLLCIGCRKTFQATVQRDYCCEYCRRGDQRRVAIEQRKVGR